MTLYVEESMWEVETDLEDLSDELVGRRVVSLNEELKEMVLDNGKRLRFYDTAECCAWFKVALKALDFEDNVITKVEQFGGPCAADDYDCEAAPFHISILSNDKQVARLDAVGGVGTGYYVKYFGMVVDRVPPQIDFLEAGHDS